MIAATVELIGIKVWWALQNGVMEVKKKSSLIPFKSLERACSGSDASKLKESVV